MHVFDVLGDPVRRRILELLAHGERSSGELTASVRREFGISQPAVSQHLKVLRDNGFSSVRTEGTRRYYIVQSDAFLQIDVWLKQFRVFWERSLDALGTELAGEKRADPVARKAQRKE